MLNLINEIDAFLMEEEGRERKGHYPSDVLDCRRQLFLKWKATPKSDPPTAGALLKMKLGNVIHAFVFHILEQRGFKINVENKDYGGTTKEYEDPRLSIPIRYRMDGIFVDPTGIKSIIEVKTSYGAGIKEIQQNGPKDRHYAQCILYQVAEGVSRVYGVFIGRDNAYRTQHIQEGRITHDVVEEGEIHIDNITIDGIVTKGNPRYTMKLRGQVVPITYDYMIDKLIDIEYLISKDELPPRDFLAAIKNGEVQYKYVCKGVTYSCWQCFYCYWKTKCWADKLQEYSHSNNSAEFGEEQEGWVQK